MENQWTLELEGKSNFEMAMKRVNAWYNQSIIDRVPIRFSAHNSDFSGHDFKGKTWRSLKERWFDAEYHVDYFIKNIKGQKFLAETFPVFWPNLGPEVYTAFHGSELEFKEVTSYSTPFVVNWEDIEKIKFDWNNPYLKKIDEMTKLALEKCNGKFMVGYTDLHQGLDCVAAWRDPQNLCIDLIMNPEEVERLHRLAGEHFQEVFDHFDAILKKHQQLSVTWLGIPSYGKMHIPSCDFSAMISNEDFEKYCLPLLQNEVKQMNHNVYHVDGKGVARHLDYILSVKEINAIQWVQGMGDDLPIMQWVPLIKRIQDAGKSVVVDLTINELDDFMKAVKPEGIMLCIAADLSDQPAIIKKVEKWK
jgi:hypothetical protein